MTVDVYCKTTIATLTATILKEAQGSTSRRYKVFHNEKELEDHMTLLDNDIRDGETLYFKRMLRLLFTNAKTPQQGIIISHLQFTQMTKSFTRDNFLVIF